MLNSPCFVYTQLVKSWHHLCKRNMASLYVYLLHLGYCHSSFLLSLAVQYNSYMQRT